VAQGADEARKQRELSKAALAADLNRLEAKVRAELDWRARLRRDGPKLAALGAGVAVVLGAVLVLRSRLKKEEPERRDPASLDDVAAELRDLRRTLEKLDGKGDSLAQKALVRALTAAGSAGGTYLARRMVRHQAPEELEGAEVTRAG
jgi:hypothetical protein